MSTVGERIKKLRHLRGFTCRELAAQVHCTRPYLSSVENGKNAASRDLLEVIARCLCVDALYLAGGPVVPNAKRGRRLDRFLEALRAHHRSPAEGSSPAIPLLRPDCRVDPMSLAGIPSGRRIASVECFIARPLEHAQSALFAFRNRGSHMEPILADGELVLAVCGEQPKSGNLVVARPHGGKLVCRKYIGGGGNAILEPINHMFPAECCTRDELAWIAPVRSRVADVYQ